MEDLTPIHAAWTNLMDPAHLQGEMRGLDGEVKGSWQILHKQREVVEVVGETLMIGSEKVEVVGEDEGYTPLFSGGA